MGLKSDRFIGRSVVVTSNRASVRQPLLHSLVLAKQVAGGLAKVLPARGNGLRGNAHVVKE